MVLTGRGNACDPSTRLWDQAQVMYLEPSTSQEGAWPQPSLRFSMLGERAQYMLASPAPKKQRTSRSSLHHPWDKALRSANGAPSKYGFLLPLSPPGPVLQSYFFQLLSRMGAVKEHRPCTKTNDRGAYPGPASVIMSIAQVRNSWGHLPAHRKPH